MHQNLVSKSPQAMADKAQAGIFPGCAPTGYLNVTRPDCSKEIVVDRMLGPLVQEAFAVAAQKRYPLRELLRIMTAKGLVSRRGTPLSLSAFWYLLKNPFYTGKLVWNGEEVKGNHEPLIEEETFAKVQHILHARARR